MSNNVITSDQVFNQSERDVLQRFAQATVPADPARNLPGADEPELFSKVLTQAEHFAARMKPGVETLSAAADGNLSSMLRLLQHDNRFRSLSRMMTIAILQAYYQHPAVLAALGLSARPPFPAGHDVPDGDWSLLDQVIARGPIYRD